MYTIRTLNNIAKTGLAKLPEQNFVIDEKAENPEGIILRSFDMHKMELNESLLAVARAGAGTNNIPIEKCTQKGVPVFNTPGANANAVKELVLAGLFASSRRIIAGAAWVQGLKDNCESVEKAVEARRNSPALKLRARPWVSSVWVRLAYRLPMRHWIWGWRLSATTPSFPWKVHGTYPPTWCMRNPWRSWLQKRITLRCTFP